MAERYYLANTGTPYTPTTKRGAWDANAATLIRWLAPIPAGAAATAAVAETNATANWDVLLGRWVGDPIPQSGTLAGTVSWVLGLLESNAAQDALVHVHIFVTAGDSNTLRGTILTDSIGAVELPTTAAGQAVSSVALSSLAVTAGDRIVVEVGYRSVEASATSRTGTMNYGNRGTADLAGADTAVTTKPGWISFSDTNGILRAAAPTRGDGAYVRKFSFGAVSFDGYRIPVVEGGTVNGEQQIAVILCDDALDLPDVPAGSGWVAKGSPQSITGAGKGQIYERIATGSEADEVWLNGTGTNVGFVVSIAGADTSAPWDVVPNWGGSATQSATQTAPDVSPSGTNSLLLTAYWSLSNNDGPDAHSQPSGMTKLMDLGDEIPPYGSGMLAVQNLTASGATGAKATTATQTSPWLAVSMAIKSAPTGTTAPAGVATATGAAQTPTPAVRPTVGVATATGTAQAPQAAVRGSAGVATATGAAQNPTVRVTVGAGVAAGTGAAASPTIGAASSAAAGSAAGVGAAQPPSVSTSQPAAAGVAAGTGAAQAPVPMVTALAGVAEGTGAALAPDMPVTGGAVRFDAATDRISYSAEAPPAEFTITAWVYVSVDTDTWATWLRVWASGFTTVGTWATDSDGTSGPAWFTASGSVVQSLGLPVGAWRRVAVSRTAGGDVVLYAATPAGSVEVDSASVSAAVPAGITIGGRDTTDSSEPFNGRVAYVRYFDGVLDQSDIEAEWSSTEPVITSGLWADWPLTSADDLTDHSGNGRDLVAGATPVTTEDGPPIGPRTAAPAGTAAGTGAAQSPTIAVTVQAGSAAGVGAAAEPAIAIAAPADVAAGTGAAASPTAVVTASAGTAAGIGAAQDPSVATSQPAPAGSATGTGTAQAPSVRITVAPAAAAGMGAAHDPALQLLVVADVAAGVGEAYNAGTSTSTDATAAAGRAAGTGAAHDPSVTVSASPQAGAASGSGAAHAPTVAVTAPAGTAEGVGAAQAPVARVAAAAGVAAGAGSAAAPGLAVTAQPATASGTGTAHDAAAQTEGQSTAAAGVATSSGAAHAPSVRVTVAPPAAAGVGAAQSPSSALTVGPDAAAGTGAAAAPGVVVTAAAGVAEGVGEALDAAAQVVGSAHAGRAAGTGQAFNPVIRIVVRPPAAAGLGRARPPQVGTVGGDRAVNGWRQLEAMFRERAEPEVERVCPNDGTPYITNEQGQRCCPFDGYRPDGWADPVPAGSWGGYTAPPRENGDYVPINDYIPGWGP